MSVTLVLTCIAAVLLCALQEKIANNIKDDERVDSEKSFLEKSPLVML